MAKLAPELNLCSGKRRSLRHACSRQTGIVMQRNTQEQRLSHGNLYKARLDTNAASRSEASIPDYLFTTACQHPIPSAFTIIATMRFTSLLLSTLTSPILASCLPRDQPAGDDSARNVAPPPKDEAGAVFAMTNTAPDNKVIAFSRNSKGELKQVGQYLTGGSGIGVDLDTQGPLVLNKEHTFLYAVSAASDLVTVFSVKGSSLKKVQEIYGGDQPVSITLSSAGYAYALDGSVASTGIFGFKVDGEKGTLTPLTNSTIPLSTPIGVPGVITFSPDGRALAVTNKVGSTLDVFAVDKDGKATGPVTTSASSGLRPFAARFNGDTLYVAEAGLPALMNGGVSSYRLNKGSVPSLTPVARSVKNEQTDTCWITVTPDDKYLYTTNFVSGTISSYKLGGKGKVELLHGKAASPGEGSEPVDVGLSDDGKYFYALLRGTGAIAGYAIQRDGSLKQVGRLFGEDSIPTADGASGLAVY